MEEDIHFNLLIRNVIFHRIWPILYILRAGFSDGPQNTPFAHFYRYRIIYYMSQSYHDHTTIVQTHINPSDFYRQVKRDS